MASVVLAARSAGKRSDSVRAFALSIAMMALVDPLVAFDLSFALSAGATGGLLAWGQPLGRSLSARAPAWAEPAARAIGTTMAASIPCIPIVARFAPTVPLGGIVANLVAVPVGESAALPLCLTHALLASWPAAERGSALAASGALVLVRAVASFASEPWALIKVPEPDSWQLAVVIVIAGAFALRCPLSRPVGWVGTAALLALEFEIRRAGAPRGELRITFLDVGQGDAALIDLPNGEALLIDAGGLVGSPIDVGARVLAPVLRARRRNAIAAAILTHPHPDHFGGFLTGLEGIEVGAFWDTGEGEREDMRGGYEAVIGAMRARGVPIVRPSLLCGEHSLGGAHIEVLEPCPDFSSDRGPNDNSFVLRISFGERAFLFVGDAEHAEESDLLSHAGGRLRADVLKVGHHGSRTSSSPQFLAAVMPRFAVISVGQRNRFGHPQEATLRALGAAGARTWRTDRDGSVTITTDGQSIEAHAQATAR
jgi:competence protein ComEC